MPCAGMIVSIGKPVLHTSREGFDIGSWGGGVDRKPFRNPSRVAGPQQGHSLLQMQAQKKVQCSVLAVTSAGFCCNIALPV